MSVKVKHRLNIFQEKKNSKIFQTWIFIKFDKVATIYSIFLIGLSLRLTTRHAKYTLTPRNVPIR